MSRDERHLDDAALARIAEHVAQQGPGIIRRARRVRQIQRAAAVGLGLIALAYLLVPREAPIEAPPARACERFAAIAIDPNESQRFDLGSRALAVASPDSSAHLAKAEPCLTELVLDRGRIDVHARDLGGGELRVLAAGTAVVVHGTKFSVETDGTDLTVEVTEGKVAVGSDAVARGERWRRKSGRISQEPIAMVEPSEPPPPPAEKEPRRTGRHKHVRKVERTPEPVETIETPDELVRRATEARKRGDLPAARALFEQAGRGSGPTAEAAWLGLARMELDAGQPQVSLHALVERQRRFGEGTLAIEAAWLKVRAHEAAGELPRAREEAQAILQKWPDSAQAKLAKKWLER